MISQIPRHILLAQYENAANLFNLEPFAASQMRGVYNPLTPHVTYAYGVKESMEEDFYARLDAARRYQHRRRYYKAQVVRQLAPSTPQKAYRQDLKMQGRQFGALQAIALSTRKSADPQFQWKCFLNMARMVNTHRVIPAYVGPLTEQVHEYLAAKPLPFKDESWFKPATANAARLSIKFPGQIAYYRSLSDLKAHKLTASKPGRFLAKFFPDLPEPVIKMWSEKVTALSAGATHVLLDNNDPKWKGNDSELQDEWAKLYADVYVAQSCMKDSDGPRAYGLPGNNIGLLYFRYGDTLLMRTIVNLKTKEYVRCYSATGHSSGKGLSMEALESLVESLGYSQATYERQALGGCKLAALPTNSRRGDEYIMPYIDGSGYVTLDSDGDTFTVNYNGYGTACDNTSGTISLADETYTCECCGASGFDEDDLSWIESTERSVCQICLDSNFRYAYGRRYEEYFPANECVYCESDNNWYVEDLASNHEVYQCEVTCKWYVIDDLVITSEGCVHIDEAQALDHEDSDGNCYATRDDAQELYDGTWCHEDDATELSDGRWCLIDDAEDLEAEIEEEKAANEETESLGEAA